MLERVRLCTSVCGERELVSGLALLHADFHTSVLHNARARMSLLHDFCMITA